MPAQTQTRRILIKVDTSDSKGLSEIASRMGQLNRSTRSLASNMDFLTNAFQAALAYSFVVQPVVRMADEMQNLGNRLKITAQEGDNTGETFNKIAALADRTNQSIESIGNVYNRLAISLSQVNPKADELIALTEVLTNSFRVAGATTSETANTMIQLSQAFSSGELRGQELRSVMEQNGVLAKILREEFGTDVYKKAEKGLIRVTDVMRLLRDNQEKILEQANRLAPTYEQTLTKAMNAVSLKIKELNEDWKGSERFAFAVQLAVENLGTAFTIFAIVALPKAIAGLKTLGTALLAFAASNPWTAFAAVVVIGAVAIYNNFNRLSELMDRINAKILDFQANATESLNKNLPFMYSDKQVAESAGNVAKLRKMAQDLRDRADMASNVAGLNAAQESQEQLKAFDNLIEKFKAFDKANTKAKPEKFKDILGKLNKELIASTISLDEYNKKLVSFEIFKLNKEFEQGKFDVFEYNKRLKELQIQGLNRQVAAGVMTFGQLNAAVKAANIAELNAKFAQGRIGLAEYNEELIKLSDKLEPGGALFVGTQNYIESIGTISQNIAEGITNTFKSLEDNLVDFIKTGQFNFAKFTESILDDLTRIIIRASILRPLAGAIVGGFSGTGGGETSISGGGGADSFSARGNAFFNGNMQKYAKGGIVDSPTAFNYGGGKRGLMGEAGAEAIVPLRRNSSGDLGVAASLTPVTINVINQSGSDVQQRETTGPSGEKTIELLITNKVKEGISTGRFDSAFSQSYGLKRKGG